MYNVYVQISQQLFTYVYLLYNSLATTQLHCGVAGLGSNATVVVIIAAHHDVALHAPIGAPAVLHQPVCFSIVSTVANHQDGMIQVSARAQWLIVHTTTVHLETWVASVNANGNWTNGSSGFLKSVFIIGLDGNIASINGSNIGGFEAAVLFASYVWVASFSVNAIVFLKFFYTNL